MEYNYKIKKCIICGVEAKIGSNGMFCLKCRLEGFNDQKKLDNKRKPNMKLKEIIDKPEMCIFCKTREKLCIHHVDKDKNNNDKGNLEYVCSPCHGALHSKIYNKLLRKFFRIMRRDRYTHEAIGKEFDTTRQNVYRILNMKMK